MKKIEVNQLADINGGSQKPNCFFVGLGYNPNPWQGLPGWALAAYNCWNS